MSYTEFCAVALNVFFPSDLSQLIIGYAVISFQHARLEEGERIFMPKMPHKPSYYHVGRHISTQVMAGDQVFVKLRGHIIDVALNENGGELFVLLTDRLLLYDLHTVENTQVWLLSPLFTYYCVRVVHNCAVINGWSSLMVPLSYYVRT
jgi:hypothetical protein